MTTTDTTLPTISVDVVTASSTSIEIPLPSSTSKATIAATATLLSPTSLPESTAVYLPIVTRSPVFNTVSPIELDSKYISNPDMGWQNIRGATEQFPATMLYDRFEWDDMNPAENVFDWNDIEALKTEAQASGQKIHFRIRNAQPEPWGPGHVIPDWVVAAGAEIVNGEYGTEPVYSNCQFLEAHAVFVNALREQYDGDSQIAYLDIGAYGYFGEWDTTQYDETPNSLDWHARRRLADMYLGGEGTRPCQDAQGNVSDVSYDYQGFVETQLLMPYTPWREETLFYVTDKRSDVGIRHDALGSKIHQDQYREEIGALIEETWRHAPIVFEFSSDARSNASLERARAFVQEMHGSVIHQNFNGRDSGVESVLEVTGFKLLLREMTYVSELEPNLPLTVMMTWENVGSAPPYQPYPLVVSLIDQYGFVVWEEEVATDVRDWDLQTPIRVVDDLLVPDSLPAGVYDLRVSFVELETWDPILNLAVEGRDSNGRYQIGTVQIP